MQGSSSCHHSSSRGQTQAVGVVLASSHATAAAPAQRELAAETTTAAAASKQALLKRPSKTAQRQSSTSPTARMQILCSLQRCVPAHHTASCASPGTPATAVPSQHALLCCSCCCMLQWRPSQLVADLTQKPTLHAPGWRPKPQIIELLSTDPVRDVAPSPSLPRCLPACHASALTGCCLLLTTAGAISR